MDGYCAGNSFAFELLFKRFEPKLLRFLRQMLTATQAQDSLQVTFMKVHKNRHRYRSGSSVSAWVFTIARNTAIDHLRSANYRRE